MHFAIEIKEQDGKCLRCGNQTILISPDAHWRIDEEDLGSDNPYDDVIEINEEVVAHYCTECDCVTGIWINLANG